MLNIWVISMIIISLLPSLFMVSMKESFLFNFMFFSEDLKVTMSLDFLDKLFIWTIFIVGASVFMWGRFYMKGSSSSIAFFLTLLLFVISMIILVVSNSFLLIFLGWEGLGLTSFVLIIFYQNWSSFNGGLLTLMTNRLGDGLFLILFSYWLLKSEVLSFGKGFTFLSIVLFIILTLTKSAQVPFTSWLPAAMAAPTPVSALVHSSTLVTAGVWLMIRFSTYLFLNSKVWLTLGLATLTLASFAALMETDAKKVVALSTLSQLGLMFLALFSGGAFFVLFHLMTHAFAKANLFLMVGNFIHSSFSQQDVRFMSSGTLMNPLFFLSSIMSIVSLSGITFTSGFFSKDLILGGQLTVLNSLLAWLIVIIIVVLTISYCVSLLSLLSLNSNTMTTSTTKNSGVNSSVPSLLLSSLSILLGFFFMKNIMTTQVYKNSLSGFYWSFAMLFLLMGFNKNSSFYSLFSVQVAMVKNITNMFTQNLKSVVSKTTSSLLESLYLVSTLSSHSVMMMTPSFVIIIGFYFTLLLLF